MLIIWAFHTVPFWKVPYVNIAQSAITAAWLLCSPLCLKRISFVMFNGKRSKLCFTAFDGTIGCAIHKKHAMFGRMLRILKFLFDVENSIPDVETSYHLHTCCCWNECARCRNLSLPAHCAYHTCYPWPLVVMLLSAMVVLACCSESPRDCKLTV